MGSSPSIFLSYATRNAKFVDFIVARLHRLSIIPWLDRQRLAGGQEWPEELERAIRECQVFLLVLTHAALRSRYVQREYQLAQALGKPMILLQAQRVRRLPVELQGTHIIDFTHGNDNGLVTLFAKLIERGLSDASELNAEGVVSLALAGKSSPDWMVFRVSRATYARIALVYGFTVLSVPLLLVLLQPSVIDTLPFLDTLLLGGPLTFLLCRFTPLGHAQVHHLTAPREISLLLASRDLPEWRDEFIENVAREGIVLYARGPLPEPLARRRIPEEVGYAWTA